MIFSRVSGEGEGGGSDGASVTEVCVGVIRH